MARALPYSSPSSSSSGYGSSSDSSSSNYGSSDSSSDSSNYGSSDYGSSDYGSSNYGSSNDQDSSSQYDQYTSSTYDVQDTQTYNQYTSTSSAEYNQYTSTTDAYNQYTTTSSTYDVQYTSTSSTYDYQYTTAYNQYTTTSSTYDVQATATYGSGSSYWGGSGYDDCVNQCIAQFGGSTGGSYQATLTAGSEGSTGTGATHTILVAPTEGVLRMFPFATNASVGDTLEFHWGASNHTVTKSSALTPCNKSSEAPVFATGERDIGFVFSEVVNDTNPIFYYCGTPTHCEKGMFGVINPDMAVPGAPTSLGGMMESMAANDSDLSAYAAYSNNITSGNNAASDWLSNIDMSSLPEWSYSLLATNVLYSRAAIAMNPDIISSDNSINLASVATTPLMLPKDISSALNAAAAAPASPSAATVAGDAATAAASPSTSASATPKNGASALASPRMLVGAVVVLATIFAL
ncbi:glycoamidase [Mycena maculata]|uniref:Glycoamidase n=1 Tax=Mycena maculata TaxID=230809 RepID=A0AAD7K0R1_9AGAR|nr:glycoamidase [Mycena maculata]